MRTIIFIITIAAAVLAARGFLFGTATSVEETTVQEASHAEPVAAGAPVRLSIPSIDVAAEIEHVGVAASGNMAVPYAYQNAGWYRSGSMPGERGSAVIDGHVDTGFGSDAVFARIKELEPGDIIYVDTAEGKRLAFSVEETEEYAYTDVPTDKLFLRDDAVRLNLITCAGTWNQEARAYDRRTVVYARLMLE